MGAVKDNAENRSRAAGRVRGTPATGTRGDALCASGISLFS